MLTALPRTLVIASGCFVCAAALVVGCSGADTQDVLVNAASSGAGSQTTSSGTSGDVSSSGTTGTVSSSGTSGATTSGTVGTSSGTSGTTTTNCATPEKEPNDSENQANALNPTRCGTVSQDDQKDFLTFTMKKDTKTLAINFNGQVRLRVNIAGHSPVELTPDSASAVPFVPNGTYTIEVTGLNSGTTTPWLVTVVEN